MPGERGAFMNSKGGFVKLTLFDKFSTYFMKAALVFIHIIIFGLCAFFGKRFSDSGYDFGWLVTPLILLIPLLFVDVAGYVSTAISRWFLRCKIDAHGIYCYGIGWRSWLIPWSEIHTYGISGYSSQRLSFALIFLSTDSKEMFDRQKYSEINQHRVVFQACDEIWQGLSVYMPPDMKNNLQWSMKHERDCFHKR